MPISPRNARALVRVAAPVSIAIMAMTAAVGCPQEVVPTPTGVDVAGGQVVVRTSPGPTVATPTPSPPPTPTPTPQTGARTPVPTPTAKVATAPPKGGGIFAPTPVPTPTPVPMPSFKDLGIFLDQGATSSSPFANNQFRVRFDGDDRLTPDLPHRRTYRALMLRGLTRDDLANRTDVLPGIYATASALVKWELSGASIVHTNKAATPDIGSLAYFVIGSSTVSSVATASAVTIEIATASLDTLLTFTATVTVSTDSAPFPDNGLAKAFVEILASNEGLIGIEISSLRYARPARLLP